MKYRLIVSDFDGTLRKTDGSVSDGTKAAIRDFRNAGGVFAICTGRMLTSILPIARELGLEGLVVAFQGNMIADISSGEVLFKSGIDPDSAAEICRVLEERGEHIHIYTEDEFFVNVQDEALEIYESVVKCKGTVIDRERLSDKILRERLTVYKIMCMVPEERKIACYSDLNQMFGDRFYVTYSAAFLVEITTKNCNKGTAMGFLCERYGILQSESIAVGDNFNDAPMLQFAGLGIAVRNASAALKEVSDLIVESNDDDGVAHVIRRFGLGEKCDG